MVMLIVVKKNGALSPVILATSAKALSYLEMFPRLLGLPTEISKLEFVDRISVILSNHDT